MITNIIDEMIEERAAFAHEVEYLKESAFEDAIDERMEVVESEVCSESVSIDDLNEGKEIFESIDISDDDELNSKEIDRILNSNGDISFEEMVGLV